MDWRCRQACAHRHVGEFAARAAPAVASVRWPQPRVVDLDSLTVHQQVRQVVVETAFGGVGQVLVPLGRQPLDQSCRLFDGLHALRRRALWGALSLFWRFSVLPEKPVLVRAVVRQVAQVSSAGDVRPVVDRGEDAELVAEAGLDQGSCKRRQDRFRSTVDAVIRRLTATRCGGSYCFDEAAAVSRVCPQVADRLGAGGSTASATRGCTRPTAPHRRPAFRVVATDALPRPPVRIVAGQQPARVLVMQCPLDDQLVSSADHEDLGLAPFPALVVDQDGAAVRQRGLHRLADDADDSA